MICIERWLMTTAHVPEAGHLRLDPRGPGTRKAKWRLDKTAQKNKDCFIFMTVTMRKSILFLLLSIPFLLLCSNLSRSGLIRVDPSWSELIRSEFCTCLLTGKKFTLLSYALRVKGFCIEYAAPRTRAMFPPQGSRFYGGDTMIKTVHVVERKGTLDVHRKRWLNSHIMRKWTEAKLKVARRVKRNMNRTVVSNLVRLCRPFK